MDNINKLLQKSGLLNPVRVRELINSVIQFYDLDLKGLTVLTETGTRYFVVTPIIAALAGAQVYAITGESRYGRKEVIREYTETFAKYCNVKEFITVLYEKNPKIINKANIITNLGFVRPINKQFIEFMNEKAVITYMCETWEFREGDVDLDACIKRNIPVLGTNEMYPGREVFSYSGHLCAKMLFELDVEIFKSKLIIVSRDKFGPVIWRFLSALGADAYIVHDLLSINHRHYLWDCDAVIIADYSANTPVIGDTDAQISPHDLLMYSEKTVVIQFAGQIETDALVMHGIPFAPKIQLGRTMGKTLADLGPKPVIDLHAAGLKVGEVMARARLAGKNLDETISIALTISPAQEF